MNVPLSFETPQAFRTRYLPEALICAERTGLDPDLFIVQWGVETAWGNQINNDNNLSNIRCVPNAGCRNGFAQFGSLSQFCDENVAVLKQPNMSAALAQVGKDVITQMIGLGETPWDGNGHYNNGFGPGSQLISYWEELYMVTLDEINKKLDQIINWINVFDANGVPTLTWGKADNDLAKAIAAVPAETAALIPGGGGGEPAEPTTATLEIPAQTIIAKLT